MDAVKEGRELIAATDKAVEALKAAAARDATNKAALAEAVAKLEAQGAVIPEELKALAADFDAAEQRINEALAGLAGAGVESAAPGGGAGAEQQPQEEAPPVG